MVINFDSNSIEKIFNFKSNHVKKNNLNTNVTKDEELEKFHKKNLNLLSQVHSLEYQLNDRNIELSDEKEKLNMELEQKELEIRFFRNKCENLLNEFKNHKILSEEDQIKYTEETKIYQKKTIKLIEDLNDKIKHISIFLR